jgi:lysophospholipase L1-like esterase
MTVRSGLVGLSSAVSLLRRARWWTRRTRDTLVFAVTVARLLIAAARGRADELWIGDSHAAHFNSGVWPCHRLRRLGPRRFVWHIGPRLMFSIARDGFPADVQRVARWLGRVNRTDRLSLILTFGEIDVRCHLAPRFARDGGPLAFPRTFVEASQGLARTAHAAVVVVVVPTPPSDGYEDAPGFPIAGSIDERLAAFAQVRAELIADAEASRPPLRVLVLDCTAELAGPTGQLRPSLTIDGCHTNDAGRLVVHDRLTALLAAAGRPADPVAAP